MTKREERDIDGALAAIRERSEELGSTTIDLNALVDDEVSPLAAQQGLVALPDLERAFLNSAPTRARFRPHPSIPGAHWLDSGDAARLVTFKPDVFDRHPSTVELLTYGNTTFERLLDEVAEPWERGSADERAQEYGIAGATMILRDDGRPPVAVCVVKEEGELGHVDTASAYEEAAQVQPAAWSSSDRERARDLLEEARARVDEERTSLRKERLEAKRRGLVEEARRLLLLSARILHARKRSPLSRGESLVDRLRGQGVPYPGLLSLVGSELSLDSNPALEDGGLRGKSDALLDRRLKALKEDGMELLERYAALEETP